MCAAPGSKRTVVYPASDQSLTGKVADKDDSYHREGYCRSKILGDSKVATANPGPIIKARLEKENGEEVVEFSASDVLAHHMPDSKHSWNDLSEQDQTSFAEDYALWAFKRKFGDHGEYRVDIL